MKFKMILLLLLVAIFAGSAAGQAHYPKTPREFFRLMPQEYFTLESLHEDKNTKEELARVQKEYKEGKDSKEGVDYDAFPIYSYSGL